jgi:hypothetical protein
MIYLHLKLLLFPLQIPLHLRIMPRRLLRRALFLAIQLLAVLAHLADQRALHADLVPVLVENHGDGDLLG